MIVLLVDEEGGIVTRTEINDAGLGVVITNNDGHLVFDTQAQPSRLKRLGPPKR